MPLDPELASFLQDLRAPLHQIIGRSQKCGETAEEDGRTLLQQCFADTRQAGEELLGLMANEKRLLFQEHGPTCCELLEELARPALSRILGFTWLFLDDPDAEDWDLYSPDLSIMQDSAVRLLRQMRGSGVYVCRRKRAGRVLKSGAA